MAEESSGDSGGIGGFFNKDVAGLPVWVWGIAILAGLGLSYYLSTRGGKSDTSSDSQNQPTVVEDTSTQPGVGRQASGWQYDPPPESDSKKSDGEFETNQEWGSYVIDQMIAQGYPPEMVDKAVRTYLSNLELTEGEQKIIDTILSKYGSPPSLIGPPETDPTPDEPITGNSPGRVPNFRVVNSTSDSITIQWGDAKNADHYELFESSSLGQRRENLSGNQHTHTNLAADLRHSFEIRAVNDSGKKGPISTAYGKTSPGAQTSNDPAPKPPSDPKPQFQWVTVTPWPSSQGSLSDIAQKYLGDAGRWREIYNMNRDRVSNPDLIYPGQRLRVPNG